MRAIHTALKPCNDSLELGQICLQRSLNFRHLFWQISWAEWPRWISACTSCTKNFFVLVGFCPKSYITKFSLSVCLSVCLYVCPEEASKLCVLRWWSFYSSLNGSRVKSATKFHFWKTVFKGIFGAKILFNG